MIEIIVLVVILAAILRWARHMFNKPQPFSKLIASLVLGFIGCALLLFYLDDGFKLRSYEEPIRLLLNVPDDVEIGSIQIGPRNAPCYKRSSYRRTTVQLSKTQFERYARIIENRSLWQPNQPPHFNARKRILKFSDDAFVWHRLPEPPWQGKQQLVWRVAQADVRRGRALCYKIEKPGSTAADSSTDHTPTYSVSGCNPRQNNRTPPGGGLVTAALDADKLRLNVEIYFDSKPDFCNNRVTKWVASTLGIQASSQ